MEFALDSWITLLQQEMCDSIMGGVITHVGTAKASKYPKLSQTGPEADGVSPVYCWRRESFKSLMETEEKPRYYKKSIIYQGNTFFKFPTTKESPNDTL